ncbi:double-strand break repair protein AddB [Methylobacterium sp. BTF04]|uniref:double-strand break repair protein AddB n=1 Tax=Methylobacterium sp. BTF04 TaxID=2708300 RepID=UPI0013D385A8|nr:double-strand break repair protein AddB [Methylobacterium sp. BTF04]NEU13589.1 double-strand break repair protein AddB [Methylobacterium sp. BTF04]
MSASHVFTIPPGAPFLPTLAEALISGRLVGDLGDDPFALAAVTLYLPTQRATRALSAILSARLGRAALLPRLVPLGEADEAELDLAANAHLENGSDVLAPAIRPLDRRLILARLVQLWAERVDRALLPIDDDVPFLVPSSPADAVALAGDLERLMDALTVAGLPWAEIGSAVEAEYSRYFGLTLDFMKIAAEFWPEALAERQSSDPVARSRELVLAEATRLRRERPSDPVIVAGSTGSVPATAKLIAAVAALPRGAVVLPGLDGDLDAIGWDAIETGEGVSKEVAHGHPQAILHRLLGPGGLGLERDAVVSLGVPSAEGMARAALLSQALRPAETTEAWAELDDAARESLAEAGMAGIGIVEATDEREEALIIAIALRETLEIPGATAALVTPDRALAVRVAADLARWGIVAEDSAGVALSLSPAGRLARLAAELAADLQPARIITLLSHPYVRLGLPRRDVMRAAAALEIGTLRGPAPAPGFAGLHRAVADQRTATGRRPRAKRRLTDRDWDLASDLLVRLETAFAGFLGGDHPGIGNLVAYATCHNAVFDKLLAGADDEPEPDYDASLAILDTLFDDLSQGLSETKPKEALELPGRFSDYPAFFTALARERPVACGDGRPRPHPRLRILGLLEARLMSVDRIVLGGLDEGVWPMKTVTDAFLNRPMRERIGLNPPERRIGQTAHDFVQALGNHDAVITRAAKREGAPTVPSRFLQRLRAFSGEKAWNRALGEGRRYAAYAAALDRGPGAGQPRLTQPKPRPDPALFPRTLSVTEVETLVRDPYVIFARHVLGLDPLDPVASLPGAAERGTLIHEILGEFAKAYPTSLPELSPASETLGDLARHAFSQIKDTYPQLYAEWWPRYERLSVRFLDWEAERRAALARVDPELSGKWPIPMGAETFTLRARADRIEQRRDGSACIVDFKTGQPPSNKEVFAGFSPQLTLEAAMLMHGAFAGFPKTDQTPELLYVHASGGRKPFEPLAVKPPKGDPREVAAIVAEHTARFRGLVARFLAGEAAYVSRPYPKFAKSYGDYDHLARVLEWSLGGEGET